MLSRAKALCAFFIASWFFLASGTPAHAVSKPSSDLLLPYFEVDLDDGTSTTFLGLANALNKPVDVLVSIHGNWGISILSVSLKLRAGEVRTFDLRDWLASGDLPDGKRLTAADLLHLQAALTGRPSPRTGLYYSTEIGSGRASGALTIRTQGTRPDALRGEYFLSDPGQGAVRGGDLANIDRAVGPTPVCFRHILRPLPESKPGDGAQVLLWTDNAGLILPAPVPADRSLRVEASIFSTAGKLLERKQLRLLPIEKLSLDGLGLIAKPFGRIELVTEDGSVVIIHASEDGRRPGLFESTCFAAPASRPGIGIVTLINDEDANTPPGPKVPLGSALAWKYRVSNVGAGTVAQIKVSDDLGNSIKCPKTSLKQGESMTCTAKGTAEACQKKNVGRARGVVGKQAVASQDPANYFGDNGAAIQIEVATNGLDANDPTGPRVPAGSLVNWTYKVRNTGSVRLYEIEVEDDHGVAVDCPRVSLGAGEAMTCLASGTAAPGQYRNTGTVTATAACGQVTDDDVSHYFGESESGLALRALTNGYDADFPPGPSIPAGSPVTWEYVVTNTGKLAVNGLAVSDDHGIAVSCPDTALQPGGTMTCIARGVATPCQYSNRGTVSGRTSQGLVSASDASNYFGQVEAAVQIETWTNGQDADVPPGPTIAIGTAVQWTYIVTNTGKVGLTGVKVSDDRGVAVACPKSELRPGESMTCSASGTAISGDYRNVGTVTAQPPCGAAVTASDPSHYRGAGDPGIRLQKLTNGQDANVPPGPTIAVGGAVSWSYVVTNSGQLVLRDVLVTDSRDVAVTCPQTELQPGEIMTCQGSGVAQACQYDNLGTVTARTPTGQQVKAIDPSYYFGEHHASVRIETSVNGNPADSPPGPLIKAGTAVAWVYAVTNAGDVALTNVSVSDDQGAVVTCPKDILQAGETMTCFASGTAVVGQFGNIGTVTASPPCGSQVIAQDPSYYFGGGEGAIGIRKLTNGQDANGPPGPTVPLGGAVSWTYIVTNTGQASLSNVGVTDNRGVTVTCPKNTLEPGESMSCTGAGTAQACQYDNLGIATGETALGQRVSAVDPSYYYGQIQPAVTLELSVNGQEADVPPGPTITVGTPVTWIFTITNSGNSSLASIQARDDKGTAIMCPKTALEPGEAMRCFGFGTAVEGPFRTLGTVTADPPCGATITALDSSNYVGGGTPGLTLRKLTNNQDVGRAPGPSIPVGSSVFWLYEVTNVGQVSVSQIVVSDDRGVAVSCPKTSLQPNESMTCTGRGTAEACQYDNLGTAAGRTLAGQQVSAVDPSFYYGQFQSGIQIETSVNGNTADSPPGPTLRAGSAVQWTYQVTNSSQVTLSNVKVVDSEGAVVSCPKTSLQAGESMTCTASGLAIEGQFSNVGSVTADPPCGSAVSAQDPSYYLGELLVSIGLRKLTNNQDVSQPPGPTVAIGSTVSWSYVVTNNGDAALSSIQVTDDQGVAVTCPKTALQPAESMTCTGSGTAKACQYQNLGTATGEATNGKQASASDSSYYFGNPGASLRIESAVNNQDADVPLGPIIPVGDPLSWTHVVTNNGNVDLTNIKVTDSQGVVVSCPQTTLAPGASTTCTAASTALQDQRLHTATAFGDPPCGGSVSATDPTYYYGLLPLRVEFSLAQSRTFIWDDRGSGANDDGSFYRPLPPAGYFILGDYGQGNYDPPTGNALTIRVTNDNDPLKPDALAFPADWTLVWNSTGSGSDVDGSIWAPVPATGYVCSGHVVKTGFGKPTTANSPGLDKYRCLRSDLASLTGLGAYIWNDKGSGADMDVTVWQVPKLNVIFGVPDYDDPPTETTYLPNGLP